MMGNWEFDKKAIEVVLPEIKNWLAAYIVTEASELDDRDYNTDLIVRETRIALRGRWVFSRRDGSNSFEKYWHEFTIRSDRPVSGHPTELAKIRAGYGDWFYYYWVDNNTNRLVCASLIDLAVLRPNLESIPYSTHDNFGPNGTDSSFRAYSLWTAANRGCVMGQRYAEGTILTYKQRQIMKLSTTVP